MARLNFPNGFIPLPRLPHQTSLPIWRILRPSQLRAAAALFDALTTTAPGKLVVSLRRFAKSSGVSLQTLRSTIQRLASWGFLICEPTQSSRLHTVLKLPAAQALENLSRPLANPTNTAQHSNQHSNQHNQKPETNTEASALKFESSKICVVSPSTTNTVAQTNQHTKQHTNQHSRINDRIEEIKKDVVSKKQRHRVLKKRDEGDPRIKEFLAFWLDEYQDIYGQPYHIARGKDGAIVKSLLKTFGLESLKELATEFMLTQDEFLDKAGYTIGTFAMRVNAIAARLGIARKEAE